MTLQMVTCPLCCQPGFNTSDALCSALVSSATRKYHCPVCNEIVVGLDKLTIHLFGHNTPFGNTLQGDSKLFGNPNKVNPTTNQSLSLAKSPAIAGNPIMYLQAENGQLFALATSASFNQYGTVTINTQNYISNTNVSNHTNTKIGDTSSSKPVGKNVEEFSSCKDLLMSGDFTVAGDEGKDTPNIQLPAAVDTPTPQTSQADDAIQPEIGDSAKNLPCGSCSLKFSNQAILAVHRQLMHKTRGPNQSHKSIDKPKKKLLNCNWCSATFNLKSSLLIHIKVTHPAQKDTSEIRKENEKLCCQICFKNFPKEANLNQHMISAHGEKPWQCPECSKTFTTKYFLRKHKRIHTGETPYECTICRKVFTFQQSYHKHMFYHTDDKPYCCSHCGRLFKELSTLNNHERIHSGEKPFSCETCGKSFRQRVSYLVHRRIHTGAMPYKCTACNKSFRYKISQRTHKCSEHPPGIVVKTQTTFIDRIQAFMNKEDKKLKDQSTVDLPAVQSSNPSVFPPCRLQTTAQNVLESTKNDPEPETTDSLMTDDSPQMATSDGTLDFHDILFSDDHSKDFSSSDVPGHLESSPSEDLGRLHISKEQPASSADQTASLPQFPQTLTFDNMDDVDLCSFLFN